jgi:branched-chain amino acid transport system ATP-binding protein
MDGDTPVSANALVIDPELDTGTLTVRDVAVHFGGVKAVDGVTFTLHGPKIFGIIGPNGSGKSTLLGAITCHTPLTHGEILFRGNPIHRHAGADLAQLGIARTFQAVRLLPNQTVLENAELGADARPKHGAGIRHTVSRWGRGGRVPDRTVAGALSRTGLAGLEDFRPAELSYGTQRRVEIARAIAMGPRLLLLDEPTAGMNQTERAEISSLLRELRGEGLCQLLVEHDVQMMIDTCDYLFAMNSGRVIAEGRPEKVVRDPEVQEAYLGRNWRAHA